MHQVYLSKAEGSWPNARRSRRRGGSNGIAAAKQPQHAEAGTLAGMQRIEHYEIAAYRTDIVLAKALGEQEVVNLLTATLEEEKQTDLKLTEVTQQAIMPAAMEEEEVPRKKPARAKAG